MSGVDARDNDETMLESALRHDRLIVFGGLGVVTAISWFWILSMSADMYGSMRGASAWAMTTTWDPLHLLLLFAMWLVMMTAMMLPSAIPLLMLYIAVVRRSAETTVRRAYLLAAGYLVIWSVFAGIATAAQRLLTDQSIVSPMMGLADVRIAAALLIVVAAYQFTPLKRDCLDACRSPFQLITSYWRPGALGAFQMGLRHGMYCLGCCWALMLLLFAGGVMNAYVIGALTLFVLIEKVTPVGRSASRIGGLVLAGIGLWLLITIQFK